MCWSKNISLAMTFIGFGFTYYTYHFIDKLWSLNIFYFTLMQLIHYIGYLYIDNCKNNINKLMSYLNYIHIVFQPTFFLLGFNSLFKKYNYITVSDYKKIINYVYFSIVIGCLLVLRLFPIIINKNLSYKLEKQNCAWCGNICTYSGNKHISFSLPLRNKPYYLTPSIFMHFALFYIPFLLLFNKNIAIIMGLIFLTSLLPSLIFIIDAAETGTIWCSISIIQWIISTYILKNKLL